MLRCMKRTLAVICAAVALAFVPACASSTDEKAETAPQSTPIDTGILGVVVPPDAKPTGGQPVEGIRMYSLDGWKFEDATEWIGQHLPPDQIGALSFRNAERNEELAIHQWCWASPASPYEMLVISVSPDPVEVTVQHSKDDLVGC